MIKQLRVLGGEFYRESLRKAIAILGISLFVFATNGCSNDHINNTQKDLGSNAIINSSETENSQGILDKQNDNNSNVNNTIKSDQEVEIDSSDKDNEEGISSESNNNSMLVDYTTIQPNEAGEIPIIMFHKFVEEYPKGNKDEYLITFEDFERLLERLYDEDFRLISVQDFINNDIRIGAGYTPVVFTFDDGVSSQYSLIDFEGALHVNPKTAVGLMVDFNKKYPDFGLKGTFYIEMDKGNSTFIGDGTLYERFDELIGLGFEIGNHTWSHSSLAAKNINEAMIAEQLGRNQFEFNKIYPEYKMNSLALPYGEVFKNENLKAHLFEGEFNGVGYENKAVFAVGWCPTVVPWSKKYNPGYVNRVRSASMIPADYDINWWLDNEAFMLRRYVSDGYSDTVVVPEEVMETVDTESLGDKKLITYKRKIK